VGGPFFSSLRGGGGGERKGYPITLDKNKAVSSFTYLTTKREKGEEGGCPFVSLSKRYNSSPFLSTRSLPGKGGRGGRGKKDLTCLNEEEGGQGSSIFYPLEQNRKGGRKGGFSCWGLPPPLLGHGGGEERDPWGLEGRGG